MVDSEARRGDTGNILLEERRRKEYIAYFIATSTPSHIFLLIL